MGLFVAILLVLQPAGLFEPPPKPMRPAAERPGGEKAGWSLLLSAPILLNLAFLRDDHLRDHRGAELFGGRAPRSVRHPDRRRQLRAHREPVLSAVGVLVGGLLAARVTQHAWVAAFSFAGIAITAFAIGAADLGFVYLFVLMSTNGFMNGLMQPSRDMIVRAVTPEGQFGKVFGFVTTGFNIGGIVAPLMFGYVMDSGHPQWVFLPGQRPEPAGDRDDRAELLRRGGRSA